MDWTLMDNRRPRHLVCRKGRFYWQPSKAMRAEGFVSRPLGGSLASAVRKAEEYNRQWDAWRSGEEGAPVEIGSMKWLISRFQNTTKWPEKESSQKAYRWACGKLIDWAAQFEEANFDRMTDEDVEELHKDMHDAFAPHSAQLIVSVFRTMTALGARRRWIDRDPAAGLRLPRPKPRDVMWTEDELEAFLKCADPMMARAAVIGFETSQRPSDIRAMKWSAIHENVIRVRQVKTGKLVDVELTQMLRKALKGPKDSIFICPGPDGGQWAASSWRWAFAQAKEKSGIRDELQFRDLRRTSVIRLGEVGCTEAEISAITGHSLKTVSDILETYLPRNAAMARAGIAKLENARATKVGTGAKRKLEKGPK